MISVFKSFPFYLSLNLHFNLNKKIMETVKTRGSFDLDAKLRQYPSFLDVESALKNCVESSSYHPSIRYIVATEFFEVEIENQAYELFNFCIHTDYGNDFTIHDGILRCQLFFQKGPDHQLENVGLENAELALELEIPLERIWLIVAKTMKSEKIIFRG